MSNCHRLLCRYFRVTLKFQTEFPISDYMDRQVCLSKNMRALLVDWMVEIQESFELNHETLYLGVKVRCMLTD